MIAITFAFADGIYTFKLGLKQMQELQERCDAGPEMIQARIKSGFPNVADLRETIRLGLIGGGLDAARALTLVERYVDDMPRVPNHLHARAILDAALIGVPDDPVGKSPAGEARPTRPA
jgi:hypothetical protein